MANQLLDVGTGGLQVLPGVKLVGMGVEEFPDGAGHGQAEVGVDVDLADGQLSGVTQLILGHADGAGHLATVGVDHLHVVLGHGGRAVEHDGEAGQAAGDLLQHVKAELGLGAGLELVSAVGGAGRVVNGAITGGMRPVDAMAFDSAPELVRVLRAKARPGDILLFKGSRGMKMEQVLDQFLEKK